MITEFFTVLGVEIGIAQQHGKGTVPHGGGQLDIRGALAGCEGSKLMAKIVKMVVGEASVLDGRHPAFLFACKHQEDG